ncbi:LamG-like jellyroll fold domain-containing protein [Echinicola vietnamensis]|uniref:LamG-like jellyroll fold domain-containing protein n=1 Tax=Echinicola vietnamensis (strain DSM 17526 / LMG 23754 / KMM 6221) TaxID=926556 RepID=L0FTR6_ECHVK|nr:LamG-like jellyroll fold domain-containing protein [Echinicola vietnamensis]AGA76692.1 hypothetical protein Echvi_0404 [Echinicola vietnamensis DSM 17526]
MNTVRIFIFLVLTIFAGNLVAGHGDAEKPLQKLFFLDFEKGFSPNAMGENNPLNKNFPELISGVGGSAAFFEGGKVLQYPSPKNLNKEEGTISFWLKPGDEMPKQGPLTLFAENGPKDAGENSFRIELFPNRFIRFSLKDSRDSYIYYHKIGAWKRNEWHHLAITWNVKKGAFIYVDGKAVSTGWMPQWEAKVYDSFFIGAGNANGEEASQVAIDEFTIYNRELTEEEAGKEFLKYGHFSAQILFKDPFIQAGKENILIAELVNPTDHPVVLKNIVCMLTDNKGNELFNAGLGEQSLEKLSHKTLQIPMKTDKSGTFSFSLTYLENNERKRAVTPLHVYESREKAVTQDWSVQMVSHIKAAEKEPIAETGGTLVCEASFGKYREAGSHFNDRFAMDFEVEAVGEPHLAIVTYPDDKPRTMEIMLQHFNGAIDFQSHTGVLTGEEYPVTNATKEFEIVFWPRSKKQAFVFMTAEKKYPAAVKDIKIYKIDKFKVASAESNFRGSVPFRSSGLYYEDPVLFHNFGTGRDLQGFVTATDRLVQYLNSLGQTEFEYPLGWYAGPLYGTSVEPFQPDIDGAQGGQRPHPDGYPAYLINRLGEQNIKFTAGLHIHTLPSLNKYALADWERIDHGEETVININKDGKLWYGYWHGNDPNFNAADPRVMHAVDTIVMEIAERYAKEPAFDGISLVMAKPKLFTFGSLASGYNDSNLQRFQKASGIKIPGYVPGDSSRFRKSYEWLMENAEAKKAWIDWRCQILYEHYAAMGRKLAVYRPDLKLKLNIFVHLMHNQRLADYLNEPPVEVMREMGIDPARYKNEKNIVINHTLVPADLRWKRSHYPPAIPNIDRTIMTAPEMVTSMQGLENVRVTIHDRYWEDAVGREKPMEGLTAMGVSEMVWRASTLNATGFHSLEPYVIALNHLDAASIVKGGYVVGTFGMEKELSEFSKALQALPATKFEDIPSLADPVRVRKKVVDGKLYLYVLNTIPAPAEISLKLKEPGELREPATNEVYAKSKTLNLKLKPYDLRVFVSSSATQDIAGGKVKVDKEWLTSLEKSLTDMENQAEKQEKLFRKHKPYLELAREHWSKKHFSRVYFLLQEGWGEQEATAEK